MQTGQRIQKLLDKIVRSIQVDADIVDSSGMIVASSSRKKIGEEEPAVKGYDIKAGKGVFAHNGRTYMRLKLNRTAGYYIAMDGTGKTVRNYCFLISSLFELYLKSTVKKMNKEEIIRRILFDEMPVLDLQELVQDYKLEPDAERCIFVIRTDDMGANQEYRILIKVFPKRQGDILLLLDNRTIILVKLVMDDTDEDEFYQLAGAIEETIMNETTVRVCIGIGKCKPNIYRIRESYMEAMQAIEVGMMYDGDNRIYHYDALLLERFLHEVPREISGEYYQIIFNDETKKILNDEMLTTIEKFFENSLNLSETARQLYIHRNTLVYRLDKVQKTLGLDLRNFHDAVTFKIMMMLEKQKRECFF